MIEKLRWRVLRQEYVAVTGLRRFNRGLRNLCTLFVVAAQTLERLFNRNARARIVHRGGDLVAYRGIAWLVVLVWHKLRPRYRPIAFINSTQSRHASRFCNGWRSR